MIMSTEEKPTIYCKPTLAATSKIQVTRAAAAAATLASLTSSGKRKFHCFTEKSDKIAMTNKREQIEESREKERIIIIRRDCHKGGTIIYQDDIFLVNNSSTTTREKPLLENRVQFEVEQENDREMLATGNNRSSEFNDEEKTKSVRRLIDDAEAPKLIRQSKRHLDHRQSTMIQLAAAAAAPAPARHLPWNHRNHLLLLLLAAATCLASLQFSLALNNNNNNDDGSLVVAADQSNDYRLVGPNPNIALGHQQQQQAAGVAPVNQRVDYSTSSSSSPTNSEHDLLAQLLQSTGSIQEANRLLESLLLDTASHHLQQSHYQNHELQSAAVTAADYNQVRASLDQAAGSSLPLSPQTATATTTTTTKTTATTTAMDERQPAASAPIRVFLPPPLAQSQLTLINGGARRGTGTQKGLLDEVIEASAFSNGGTSDAAIRQQDANLNVHYDDELTAGAKELSPVLSKAAAVSVTSDVARRGLPPNFPQLASKQIENLLSSMAPVELGRTTILPTTSFGLPLKLSNLTGASSDLINIKMPTRSAEASSSSLDKDEDDGLNNNESYSTLIIRSAKPAHKLIANYSHWINHELEIPPTKAPRINLVAIQNRTPKRPDVFRYIEPGSLTTTTIKNNNNEFTTTYNNQYSTVASRPQMSSTMSSPPTTTTMLKEMELDSSLDEGLRKESADDVERKVTTTTASPFIVAAPNNGTVVKATRAGQQDQIAANGSSLRKIIFLNSMPQWSATRTTKPLSTSTTTTTTTTTTTRAPTTTTTSMISEPEPEIVELSVFADTNGPTDPVETTTQVMSSTTDDPSPPPTSTEQNLLMTTYQSQISMETYQPLTTTAKTKKATQPRRKLKKAKVSTTSTTMQPETIQPTTTTSTTTLAPSSSSSTTSTTTKPGSQKRKSKSTKSKLKKKTPSKSSTTTTSTTTTTTTTTSTTAAETTTQETPATTDSYDWDLGGSQSASTIVTTISPMASTLPVEATETTTMTPYPSTETTTTTTTTIAPTKAASRAPKSLKLSHLLLGTSSVSDQAITLRSSPAMRQTTSGMFEPTTHYFTSGTIPMTTPMIEIQETSPPMMLMDDEFVAPTPDTIGSSIIDTEQASKHLNRLSGVNENKWRAVELPLRRLVVNKEPNLSRASPSKRPQQQQQQQRIKHNARRLSANQKPMASSSTRRSTTSLPPTVPMIAQFETTTDLPTFYTTIPSEETRESSTTFDPVPILHTLVESTVTTAEPTTTPIMTTLLESTSPSQNGENFTPTINMESQFTAVTQQTTTTEIPVMSTRFEPTRQQPTSSPLPSLRTLQGSLLAGERQTNQNHQQQQQQHQNFKAKNKQTIPMAASDGISHHPKTKTKITPPPKPLKLIDQELPEMADISKNIEQQALALQAHTSNNRSQQINQQKSSDRSPSESENSETMQPTNSATKVKEGHFGKRLIESPPPSTFSFVMSDIGKSSFAANSQPSSTQPTIDLNWTPTASWPIDDITESGRDQKKVEEMTPTTSSSGEIISQEATNQTTTTTTTTRTTDGMPLGDLLPSILFHNRLSSIFRYKLANRTSSQAPADKNNNMNDQSSTSSSSSSLLAPFVYPFEYHSTKQRASTSPAQAANETLVLNQQRAAAAFKEEQTTKQLLDHQLSLKEGEDSNIPGRLQASSKRPKVVRVVTMNGAGNGSTMRVWRRERPQARIVNLASSDVVAAIGDENGNNNNNSDTNKRLDFLLEQQIALNNLHDNALDRFNSDLQLNGTTMPKNDATDLKANAFVAHQQEKPASSEENKLNLHLTNKKQATTTTVATTTTTLDARKQKSEDHGRLAAMTTAKGRLLFDLLLSSAANGPSSSIEQSHSSSSSSKQAHLNRSNQESIVLSADSSVAQPPLPSENNVNVFVKHLPLDLGAIEESSSSSRWKVDLPLRASSLPSSGTGEHRKRRREPPSLPPGPTSTTTTEAPIPSTTTTTTTTKGPTLAASTPMTTTTTQFNPPADKETQTLEYSGGSMSLGNLFARLPQVAPSSQQPQLRQKQHQHQEENIYQKHRRELKPLLDRYIVINETISSGSSEQPNDMITNASHQQEDQKSSSLSSPLVDKYRAQSLLNTMINLGVPMGQTTTSMNNNQTDKQQVPTSGATRQRIRIVKVERPRKKKNPQQQQSESPTETFVQRNYNTTNDDGASSSSNNQVRSAAPTTASSLDAVHVAPPSSTTQSPIQKSIGFEILRDSSRNNNSPGDLLLPDLVKISSTASSPGIKSSSTSDASRYHQLQAKHEEQATTYLPPIETNNLLMLSINQTHHHQQQQQQQVESVRVAPQNESSISQSSKNQKGLKGEDVFLASSSQRANYQRHLTALTNNISRTNSTQAGISGNAYGPGESSATTITSPMNSFQRVAVVTIGVVCSLIVVCLLIVAVSIKCRDSCESSSGATAARRGVLDIREAQFGRRELGGRPRKQKLSAAASSSKQRSKSAEKRRALAAAVTAAGQQDLGKHRLKKSKSHSNLLLASEFLPDGQNASSSSESTAPSEVCVQASASDILNGFVGLHQHQKGGGIDPYQKHLHHHQQPRMFHPERHQQQQQQQPQMATTTLTQRLSGTITSRLLRLHLPRFLPYLVPNYVQQNSTSSMMSGNLFTGADQHLQPQSFGAHLEQRPSRKMPAKEASTSRIANANFHMRSANFVQKFQQTGGKKPSVPTRSIPPVKSSRCHCHTCRLGGQNMSPEVASQASAVVGSLRPGKLPFGAASSVLRQPQTHSRCQSQQEAQQAPQAPRRISRSSSSFQSLAQQQQLGQMRPRASSSDCMATGNSGTLISAQMDNEHHLLIDDRPQQQPATTYSAANTERFRHIQDIVYDENDEEFRATSAQSPLPPLRPPTTSVASVSHSRLSNNRSRTDQVQQSNLVDDEDDYYNLANTTATYEAHSFEHQQQQQQQRSQNWTDPQNVQARKRTENDDGGENHRHQLTSSNCNCNLVLYPL